MEIELDYSVGSGGEAFVTKNGKKLSFNISEFIENEYEDVGIQIEGEGLNESINNIYNRNALPDNEHISSKEYDEVFKAIEQRVFEEVEKLAKSFE